MGVFFNRFKAVLLVSFLVAFCTDGFAQDSLALSDIFLRNAYRPVQNRDFRFSPDSKYLTLLSSDKGGNAVLLKYKLPYSEQTKPDTLLKSSDFYSETKVMDFEDYQWDASGTKLLLFAHTEQIYRRSSRSLVWVYDFNTRRVYPVSTATKVLHATFSPDGTKVAYVRQNNMYCFDLLTQTEFAITTDGFYNNLIHGNADWVYEEEFELTRAFEWSPDSRQVAFLSFDESKVPEYDMQVWNTGLYPDSYKFKYPKAGESNSQVSLVVYDLPSKKLTKVFDDTEDGYIPRITWTQVPGELSFIYLNRLQNRLIINHLKGGILEEVYVEKSESYVELPVVYRYLKYKPWLLLSSEKDGARGLYTVDLSNKQRNVQRLLKENFEIEEIVEVDDTPTGKVYFNYIDAAIYTRWGSCFLYKPNTSFVRSEKKGSAYLEAVSSNGVWLMEVTTSASRPNSYSILNQPQKGGVILEDNGTLKSKLASKGLLNLEFMSLSLSDSLKLNAWMIKPKGFDPAKKYPVLMYVYGGPGIQTVTDKWFANNYLWFEYLAQQGYIVVSVDGRGTGGRGAEFKKCTYGQLGRFEIEDQLAAAKYLGGLAYVDKDRIGIWGWSFGGYVAGLGATYGSSVFKMAISVAPVTSWRFYDSIYTERFLGMPSDNKQGYDRFSPITMADKLKIPYLLIHGTADDNVHFQNAVLFQNALIKAGKQFDSFYYPDKNHSIYGGSTRYHLYTMMTNFIKKNL